MDVRCVCRVTWSWRTITHIEKANVIIGDSNLPRIPVYADSKLQVDSFPGATCTHITALLRKLTIQPQVERVILLVGLNNCLREQPHLTMFKQMQQLVATATSVFPMASILVFLIHFSERLPVYQVNLIKEINMKIRTKFEYLQCIACKEYQAHPRDPIHWTKETVDKILKHWLTQLNM